jgi:hypothetical protein
VPLANFAPPTRVEFSAERQLQAHNFDAVDFGFADCKLTKTAPHRDVAHMLRSCAFLFNFCEIPKLECDRSEPAAPSGPRVISHIAAASKSWAAHDRRTGTRRKLSSRKPPYFLTTK